MLEQRLEAMNSEAQLVNFEMQKNIEAHANEVKNYKA